LIFASAIQANGEWRIEAGKPESLPAISRFISAKANLHALAVPLHAASCGTSRRVEKKPQ
jgi:hypothetical protein